MAEPTGPNAEAFQQQIAQGLNSILGFGQPGVMSGTENAIMMLALIQQDRLPDQEKTANARAFYEELFEGHKTALLAARKDAPPNQRDVTDAEVRTQMAEGVIEQFKVLSSGIGLSEDAQERIHALFENPDGAEGFANAVVADHAPRQAYRQAFAEYQRYQEALEAGATPEGPAPTKPERTGQHGEIMLLLLKPPVEGQPGPGFDKIDVSGVKVSAADQNQAVELAAMQAILDFNTDGLGAEVALARLQGIPHSTWGEFNRELDPENGKNWLGYENLQPRVIGPRNEEQRAEFWASENANSMITEALVKRGLVEFSSDDARAAWNAHMAEALSGDGRILKAQELLDHMRDFAGERPDVTMKNETVADHENLLGPRSITGRWSSKEFIVFNTTEAAELDQAKLAFAQAVEEAYKRDPDGKISSPQELLEALENVPDPDDPSKSFLEVWEANPVVTINRDKIAEVSAQMAPSAPDADRAPGDQASLDADIISDPRSAYGAIASLAGESGVGFVMDADPDQTTKIAMVASLGLELRGAASDVAPVDPRLEQDVNAQMRLG